VQLLFSSIVSLLKVEIDSEGGEG